MEHLTSPELMTFILVLVGLAALVTSIDKGIESWKHLSGAKERKAHDEAVDSEIRVLNQRMAAAENRLERGDDRFDGIESDLTQLLNVMNGYLLHQITGNSVDRLKEIKADLDEYMARRR